ncbi:MAG: hypothetical protein A2069_03595 [Planctomycetes bacterium GWB2_41_19]|nr:MAG: hypothetical protein A2069_03595 [Planctomycetes bacterium GWB2_41_19]
MKIIITESKYDVHYSIDAKIPLTQTLSHTFLPLMVGIKNFIWVPHVRHDDCGLSSQMSQVLDARYMKSEARSLASYRSEASPR